MDFSLLVVVNGDVKNILFILYWSLNTDLRIYLTIMDWWRIKIFTKLVHAKVSSHKLYKIRLEPLVLLESYK